MIRLEWKADAINGTSDTYIVKSLILTMIWGQNLKKAGCRSTTLFWSIKISLQKNTEMWVLANVFATDLDISEYDYIQVANILNDQLVQLLSVSN